MSLTEIAGMLRRSDSQWSPSSYETQTWVSVEPYNSLRRLGSSRMEFTTTPAATAVLISVQLLPPSCVRKKCGLMSSMRSVFAAMYAVFASKCPASMLKMRVHGWMADGVTFDQLFPPSTVTCTAPSSVPAPMTRMSRGDGATAVIEPSGVAVTLLPYLPVVGGTPHVARARSGLMRVHEWPRSVVFHTTFEA